LRPLRLCGRYSEFRLRLCRAGTFALSFEKQRCGSTADKERSLTSVRDDRHCPCCHSERTRGIFPQTFHSLWACV